MSVSPSLVRFLALFGVTVLGVCSARATSVTVRGGSNYGDSTGGFNACVAGTTDDACEDFNGTPVGTVLVDVDGTNITANVYQYVYGSGQSGDGTAQPGTILDIIDLGPTATSLIEADSTGPAGSTFSLGAVTSSGSVSLPSMFDTSTVQVFSCGQSGTGTEPYSDSNAASNGLEASGSGGSFLYDSGTKQISTTCTQQLTSAPNITLNSGSFTATNLSLVSGDLVLDASNAGAVTPTPEPGSLMLLGTGLVGLAVLALKSR
jgi:hypothetical protein